MEEYIVPIVVAVFASQGLWKVISELIVHFSNRHTVQDRLLLGLAHDRIHYVCLQYLKRQEMTEDEVDTLEAIAEPYLEMGGNGSGKRLYEECKHLKVVKNNKVT